MIRKRVEGAGNARKTTARLGRFYVATRFLVATELFWFCVITGVPYVVTWFSSFKKSLCRDIAFPCHHRTFASLS